MRSKLMVSTVYHATARKVATYQSADGAHRGSPHIQLVFSGGRALCQWRLHGTFRMRHLLLVLVAAKLGAHVLAVDHAEE